MCCIRGMTQNLDAIPAQHLNVGQVGKQTVINCLSRLRLGPLNVKRYEFGLRADYFTGESAAAGAGGAEADFLDAIYANPCGHLFRNDRVEGRSPKFTAVLCHSPRWI